MSQPMQGHARTLPEAYVPDPPEPPAEAAQMREILLSNSWFSGLPDYLIREILATGHRRTFSARELVHGKGDFSDGIYAVLSGAVKVCSISADGLECVFRYLSPGNWFGEIGTLDHSMRTHDAQAIEDSELFFLSSLEVSRILENHPIFYKFLALLLCRVVRTAFTMLDDSALLSVSARLAKRLISFAEAYGEPRPGGTLIRLHLTQTDLATIINTTRQTINKRLVCWQELGWIDARYGRIMITNIEALRQFAEEE